jgi:hypothetical protein
MSYSANLDKYLYEATAPDVAVGSAILIHADPSFSAKNSSPRGQIVNAAYRRMQYISSADVIDGCSSIMYNSDGSCGNCDGYALMEEGPVAAAPGVKRNMPASYSPGPTKIDGTFMRLFRTGAFDLPYLTTMPSDDAEVVKGVSHRGEQSTVVRVARGQALALGHGDIQITVRHRDGAPVAFDYFDQGGNRTKHFEASYVGNEMTSLSASDYQQNIDLNIELKSVGSIKRNARLSDDLFTVDHLYSILNKKKSAGAEE